MRTLRNKTNKQRGWGRDKSRNRPLTIEREHTMVTRAWGVGGGWGNQVMGITERTCDEHWGMYGSVESLQYTPETNTTLSINSTGIKI